VRSPQTLRRLRPLRQRFKRFRERERSCDALIGCFPWGLGHWPGGSPHRGTSTATSLRGFTNRCLSSRSLRRPVQIDEGDANRWNSFCLLLLVFVAAQATALLPCCTRSRFASRCVCRVPWSPKASSAKEARGQSQRLDILIGGPAEAPKRRPNASKTSPATQRARRQRQVSQ